MKIIVFIILFLSYLGANYYVFHRIWQAMPPHPIGRIALVAFALIVVSSFFIFYAFGENLPMGLSTALYNIGGSWFFILLFFFIVFFVKDLIGFANRFIHFMPADALTRYTKENWVGLGFMIGFIALLMICGYLKYNWKVRTEVPIRVDKPINDSTAFGSMRIVAISDLHLGYGITKTELDGWIETINSENPDIVLIAGDIIDASARPLIEGNYAESFKNIKAPMGVYACLGNHEYISGLKNSIDFIEKAGIKLLRDSVAEVDDSFYVVGRDDKMNEQRKSIEQLVKDLDHSKPIILLDHQPYHLDEAEKNNIDLQISGHTHQGQVWPISMITKQLYELDHGHKKKGNTNIIVSSGIGIWGGKFRIGTQSEYVVIDINRNE